MMEQSQYEGEIDKKNNASNERILDGFFNCEV